MLRWLTLDQFGMLSCSIMMAASSGVGFGLRFGSRSVFRHARVPRASPSLCGVRAAAEEVPRLDDDTRWVFGCRAW